jgi:hypothetical protein
VAFEIRARVKNPLARSRADASFAAPKRESKPAPLVPGLRQHVDAARVRGNPAQKLSIADFRLQIGRASRYAAAFLKDENQKSKIKNPYHASPSRSF